MARKYKVKVRVNYKDGDFQEVATSFSYYNIAQDWCKDRVQHYSAIKPIKDFVCECAYAN